MAYGTFSPAAFGPRHRVTQALMGIANPRPQFPGAPPTLPGAAVGAPPGGMAGAPAPSPVGAQGAAQGMPDGPQPPRY